MPGALDEIATWEVEHASAAVIRPEGVVETHGDTAWVTRIASVTKPLVAYAALIAVEEGTLDLDQPAGPPGSTLRHLLAHTSGLPFDGSVPVAGPGVRRIYSNTGFEVLGDALARAAAMPVATYLDEAVLSPLGMRATELRGSPAKDIWSNVDDLARFTAELLRPALVAAETLAAATQTQFPGLPGVVPGLGRYESNDWGLGFEIKDAKQPHWTAPDGSPATYGHFGGSGTYLWVDPDAHVGCVCLTDREFGAWAIDHWPRLNAHVLKAHGASVR